MKQRTSLTILAVLVATILTGAPSSAAADTYDLQAYIFCDVGTWCGYQGEELLRNNYYVQIGILNEQYRITGISFRPLPPIIMQDNRYSGMTGPQQTYATNGELNADLQNELIALFGAPNPGRITLFLAPLLGKCWNGIPCPGEDDGFDGDDIIFCYPPGGSLGLTYAHEMGHMWCLRHTFTFQDPANNNPVDRNGDDNINPACGTLSNVSDTPDDPGVMENTDFSNGLPLTGKEWCVTTTHDGVDPGSAMDSYCTVECFEETATSGTQGTPYQPLAENAMSYFSESDCRGPFTIGGQTSQPFTPSQIAQIHECSTAVPVRSQPVEVCGALGGDTDRDGWCDAEDSCPLVANTLTLDTDNDGIPNECDLCPIAPDPTNIDTDNDGVGDVCDLDDDDDGCIDRGDQHPLESSVVIGTRIHVNCAINESPWYGFEGDDTDGDGLLNCLDLDDDNDSILDDEDACPNHADQTCVTPGEVCPLIPLWDICLLGGCNELFLRLESLINPDPTTTVLFHDFQFVGDQLVISPLPDRSLSETAMALLGEMALPGGITPEGMLQLDLMAPSAVESEPPRVIATLATYDPRVANAGNIVNGRRLAVQLPDDSHPLALAATWSYGDTPGGTPMDSDADRVPDFADRCLMTADPRQADADRDGFGDACDADFDQDGLVTDTDLEAMEECLGIRLDTDYVFPHCGSENSDHEPPAANDLESAILQHQCRVMDLDGDGQINADDIDIATESFGRPPGPSGVVVPLNEVFTDGFEAGDINRWSTTSP